VPTYDELVFVASEETASGDDSRLPRFLAALERGTQRLRRDPRQALRGLLEANPDLDPRLQRASMRATLPLFLPPEGRPYGWQEPREWDRFARWMRENQLLKGEPDAASAFTNELLPGRGPATGG
jgi:putative hydroxymethylpyrimidine transport system substrate-binding protein